MRFLFVLLSVCMLSCVEEISPSFIDFEDLLVVEATITDNRSKQRVFLSRSIKFKGSIQPEVNAKVSVVEDSGLVHNFEEVTDGTYISQNEFNAEPDVLYTLKINTNNNKQYESEIESLTLSNPLDSLTARRIINDDGVDGIAIFVNSSDETGPLKNYRYTYEETFKIIAPKWNPSTLIPADDFKCAMELAPNTELEKICYGFNLSNNIIQTSTKSFATDVVENFMVHFIPADSYILSHRYSILVRQFVQTDFGYSFYRTLNQLSTSESLLSETQNGFVQGNIKSLNNPSEQVLGYFEVSSMSEQRIFFNFTDFYEGEPLPPYVDPCIEIAPPLLTSGGDCFLEHFFETGLLSFVSKNGKIAEGEGPFLVAPRVCGDCRLLGSETVPEFWEE
ncbi:DUF4249 domain-containing protein [Flagellimonas sp. 2504JD1-5]